MTTITHSVGKQGANKKHDVLLVQTMLKHVKNKQGKPYLAGKCDGSSGPQTIGAITAFQKDHVLVSATPPAGEALGLITPHGVTLKRLAAKLPARYRTMRIIPNTNTVYLGQSKLAFVTIHAAVFTHPELVPDLRVKLALTTAKMWHDHGIALSVPWNGWRRPFALQAKIQNDGKEPDGTNTKTGSGAGESNHQYGHAVDIGFDGLEWFDDNGALKKDDHWLNKMPYRRNQHFWAARNKIAFDTYGLYKTNKRDDLIHVQTYSDDDVSMGKSLAEHLTTVSQKIGNNHKWTVALSGKNRYSSNYGLGGKTTYLVGTAEKMAEGVFAVDKVDLAAALNAKLKSDKKFDVAKFFGETAAAGATQPASYTAAQIKDSYVKTMKKRLQADFVAADEHWILWKPVSK